MASSRRVLVAAVVLWLGVLVGACGDRCGPAGSSARASSSSAPSSATSALAAPTGETPRLVFKKLGKEVASLTIEEILAKVPAETVQQLDPYYNREKTFRAVPLVRVLDLVFSNEKLAEQEYVFRAKDGYTVPMRGALATEPGAYIAFEDVEVPGWEAIGQQRANPAPFYLVWSKKEQQNLDTHPRPYQLATIEIARFEEVFPHTVPTEIAEGLPARRGFATFREQCILCHAVNRDGGRVGPELNVPQSIVEYRPVDQIKAYIKNPLTFRYSQMPPHPGLSDGDLDDLVAYFSAMKERKYDPDGPAPKTPSAGASGSALRPVAPPPPPTVRPPTPSSIKDPFSSRL